MFAKKLNSKGLSDIVTTVLIILLVLAAVVIVWNFVKPTVNQVSQVEQTSCLSLDIVPTKCTIATPVSPATTAVATVTYKVNSLGGAAKPASIKALMNDGTTVMTETTASVADEFNTGTLTTTGLYAVGDTVTVAAVMQGTSTQFSCSPSTVSVKCIAA